MQKYNLKSCNPNNLEHNSKSNVTFNLLTERVVTKSTTLSENTLSKVEKESLFNYDSLTFIKSEKGYFTGYGNLNDAVSIINKIPYTAPENRESLKSESIGALTGLFKNESYSLSSEHLYKKSNILPFDIDVKETENKELYNNKELRNKVYSFISKFSILQGLSNSQKGLFGYFHVKGLSSINFDSDYNRFVHKNHYAELVYNHVQTLVFNEFGINIKFDTSLGKLRQIRYFAHQQNKISLNKQFYIFTVPTYYPTIEVKQYKPLKELVTYDSNSKESFLQRHLDRKINEIETSISNASEGNRHDNLLKQSRLIGGFIGGGWLSNSQATEILINAFGSHSARYNPKNTIKDGIKYGISKPITKESVLQSYANSDLSKNYTPNKGLIIVDANKPIINQVRIKQNKYSIDYYKTLEAKRYVSEVNNEIIQEIHKNKNTLIHAHADSGKTYAFLNKDNGIAHKLKGKVLILLPLVAVVEQIEKEYDIPGLTGNSSEIDKQCAVTYDIVCATYEQGIKVINAFDYVVIDEAHGVLNDNFRLSVLSDLINKVADNDRKVIYITATPNNLFKHLGAKILKINLSEHKNKTVIYRKAFKTAWDTLSYHETARTDKTGIYIYKVQSVDTINAFRQELISKYRYQKDEIEVFYSDENIKESDSYKKLIEKGTFNRTVKVVLVTSLVNSGLNFKDPAISEFIDIAPEKEYYPNTDNATQLFARGRTDFINDVSYIQYVNIPKEQKNIIPFDANTWYIKELRKLKKDLIKINYIHQIEFSHTENINRFNTVLSENKYYIFDKHTNTYIINTVKLLQECRDKETKSFSISNYIEYQENIQNVNTVNEIESIEVESFDNSTLKDYRNDSNIAIFEAFTEHLRLLIDFALFSTSNLILVKMAGKYGVHQRNIDSDNFKLLPNLELLSQNKKLITQLLLRYFHLYSMDMEADVITGCLFKTDKKGLIKLKSHTEYKKTIIPIELILLYVYGVKKNIEGVFEYRSYHKLTNILHRIENMPQTGVKLVSIKQIKNIIHLIEKKHAYFRIDANVKTFVGTFFNTEIDKNNIKVSDRTNLEEKLLYLYDVLKFNNDVKVK